MIEYSERYVPAEDRDADQETDPAVLFDAENPDHMALARDAWESVRNGLDDGMAGIVEIMADAGVTVLPSAVAEVAGVLL